MPKYRIILDRNKCIGCGACSMANEKYFQMQDDGKSHLIGSNIKGNSKEELGPLEEDYDFNIEAAESCPVNCIHIYKIKEDETQEKII